MGNISCGTHPNFDERRDDTVTLPCRVLPYTIYMTRSEYIRFLHYATMFVEKKLTICRRCPVAVDCYPNGKHSINFETSSTDFAHLILRDESRHHEVNEPIGLLHLPPGQQVLQLGFALPTYRALLAMKNLLIWESGRWNNQQVNFPALRPKADVRARRLQSQLKKVKKQQQLLQRKRDRLEFLLLYRPDD